GKKERGNAEFIPERVTTGLPAKTFECRDFPDPVEYVLGERVEQKRLEMRLPHVPSDRMNIGKKSHADVSFEGEERREVAVDSKLIFIASAIEKRAAEQVPDRAKDQQPADQHEVGPQLQQRLEIALEVRRARSRPLGLFRLAQHLQILPREGDGV